LTICVRGRSHRFSAETHPVLFSDASQPQLVLSVSQILAVRQEFAIHLKLIGRICGDFHVSHELFKKANAYNYDVWGLLHFRKTSFTHFRKTDSMSGSILQKPSRYYL